MRKLFMLLPFTLTLLISCSCHPSIDYSTDRVLKSSYQEKSPEYPMEISGFKCKDLRGRVGHCSMKIYGNEGLTIKIYKRPYSYRVKIQCTNNVGLNEAYDVDKNKEFSRTINNSIFPEGMSACKVIVNPHDRPEKKAYTIININKANSEYVTNRVLPQSGDYEGKKYVVFGKHALHITYAGRNEKKERTYVKYLKNAVGYSESYSMRFNYYRW